MPATAEQVEQARILIEQQAASRERAVTAAIALAVANTRSFNDWYSTASITAWALRLALAMEAIQRNLARQTDAFLARQATLMTGRTVRPVGAIDVATLRQGITHPGAYGRVADQFRYQQSRIDAGAKLAIEAGGTVERAVAPDLQPAIEAAVERAAAVAETDTQLVVREQARQFMTRQSEAVPEQRRLIGYRRIVHPELSAGGSCGMCIVASTRLYKRDDLMPIHTHCNCLPMPIYAGADPGGIVNDTDLERFYAEAGGKQAEELKRTRYQVDEHGELGPVLSQRGTAFRTAEEVADDER